MPGTTRILWGHVRLEAVIEVDEGGRAYWEYLGVPRSSAGRADLGESHRPVSRDAGQQAPPEETDRSWLEGLRSPLPLIEIETVATGTQWSGTRYVDSNLGKRLRYRSHERGEEGGWQSLAVVLEDPLSGLVATLQLRSHVGIPAVRATVTLKNEGRDVSVIQVVSCLVVGRMGPARPAAPEDLDLFWVDNEWLSEGRSHQVALRSLLPDVTLKAHEGPPRGCFRLQSNGSWGSGEHLPIGGLCDRASGTAWVWQIENSGGWHWQVGERADGAYLLLSGPTDREHQWQLELAPGQSFTTVSAALVIERGSLETALASLTAYRRRIRKPHLDLERLPIIYSDYMNTLMGDQTTDRLAPLIDAAANMGAEVFCIDAGWQADSRGWWDEVGNWYPAKWRFPRGLGEVTERISKAGLVPGIFLEPEVVGVHTEAAGTLPSGAFFHRRGVRVAENGRYHLDLRSSAAIAFLDETVDRLVREFGIGYIKFDYNINVGAGTDLLGESPGAGLLGHNRAYLAWIDSVAQRHPDLIIENCASGGMRSDCSLSSRTQVQSTSDQQDLMRVPAIAAATPFATPPEQAGIWAYPQPGFSDDEIAFTVCGALLGRVVLSGHLDRMSESQRSLVREGLDVYKNIRRHLATGSPFWPLGFPGWVDPWLAVGTKVANGCYLTVWRRDEPSACRLEVPSMAGLDVEVSLLYPSRSTATASWHRDTGTLEVNLARPGQACLYHLARR